MADHVPGYRRMLRLPRQIFACNPFDGDSRPTRVPIFKLGRPTLPFPHPWNYDQPIRMLETYFFGADQEEGPGRHNRYLEIPDFAPIFVSRDPAIIRAITTETGDKPGQFDRDTLPSTGIARATGKDSLLFSNGPFWRTLHGSSPLLRSERQRCFNLEMFQEFAKTFRCTVDQRLDLLRQESAEQRSESRQYSPRAGNQSGDAGDADQQLLRREIS